MRLVVLRKLMIDDPESKQTGPIDGKWMARKIWDS